MNYGPLVFLSAFLALAVSWFGFVLTPQMQVGQLQQTNAVPSETVYPVNRPGLAREGLMVYRANGCAYCHSQQVGQTGAVCDVVLTEPGTNQPALIAALRTVKPGWSEAEAREFISRLPNRVVEGVTKPEAEAALKTVKVDGANAQLMIVPVGPDIARHWGKRRTVAEDFLFDNTVLPGSQRVGPDLANIGERMPDPNWQMRHLFAPRLETPDSAMPSYRFLFETRRIGRVPSPDALQNLPPQLAPGPGYEIVPKPEARELVAYLTSLRADEPLYVAPLSILRTPSKAANTNAAAASSTNAPAK